MDDSGRAGLRFTDMPKDSREQLDTWLASQGEKKTTNGPTKRSRHRESD